MKNIYLDHSATTPLDKDVLKAMMPYLSDEFGNASSVHGIGQKPFLAVKKARENTALFLNCQPKEVIFSSGATESNNLAIFGLIRALRRRKLKKMHLITSAVEHPSVIECFKTLEKDDDIEVSYLPVDKNGVVKLEELEKSLKENTVFVSIMYVNNEVGAIQPIEKMGELIEKIKKDRKENKAEFPLYFHSDAVQAVNFFSCDVKKLKVDMLSLSGHKAYGPKGVGVLFVKENLDLLPVQLGGHQEGGLRSGTLNVPGIVGMGEALILALERREDSFKKVSKLRSLLLKLIQENIPDASLNGELEKLSPSHANITFKGVEGESVLLDLDFEDIAVSTGSACASGSLNASPVILAMGISREDAHGTIRFTLGKDNTEEEIRKVAQTLPAIIERFRKMAPEL